MRISKIVRVYVKISPWLLSLSLAIPLLVSAAMSFYLGMRFQTALKCAVNVFFAITSPFDFRFPYSVLLLLCVVSGYLFFPTFLTLVLDRLFRDAEYDTRLWVSAYHDAARVYPEKTKQELVKIADELVKQTTSASK